MLAQAVSSWLTILRHSSLICSGQALKEAPLLLVFGSLATDNVQDINATVTVMLRRRGFGPLEVRTMSISRIDLLQLFDIDLSRKWRMSDVRRLLDSKSRSPAYERYKESFQWLFEAQSMPADSETRANDPTTLLLSQKVNCPYSLDRFDRFALAKDNNDPADQGGVITISQSLRAAMVCIWRQYDGAKDPLEIRHSGSVDIPKHYLKQLSGLFDNISEGQMMYPFLSLRYSSSDLGKVLDQDGVLLGTLVSGGLDHEPDETMKRYVVENLSWRRYEGLFLQSTSGMGIYTSGTERTESADIDLYENTLFRAVQVCEVCLLERRLLRTFRTRADGDAKKVRIIPRPFLVEKRREELLVLEDDLINALPFWSPESMRLVRKAQEIFNIPIFLRDAKDSYNFLESRYQNTKTTALAALAVAAYVLDKLGVWQMIGNHLGIR